MDNSVVFKDFKCSNNLPLSQPSTQVIKENGKFSPLNVAIPVSTSGIGALGGFLAYKLKENQYYLR